MIQQKTTPEFGLVEESIPGLTPPKLQEQVELLHFLAVALPRKPEREQW
jgi:hypothetical protein